MSQLVTATDPVPSADDAELDLAREIQSAFVPGKCYGWPGSRIATRRIAGVGLGGDFHNVIPCLDEQYSLVVGSVTGPGIFAALGKAVLSEAVRKFGAIGRSPRVLIDRLSRMLDRINADLRDRHVTCSVFHALANREKGTLEYCNAGSCRPLVRTREGRLRELPGTRPALGKKADPDCGYDSLELDSFRRLIVYSDGLAAACSGSGEAFGAARGHQLVNDTMHMPAEEQVDAIMRALRDYVGTDSLLTVDATVFVTEVAEGATANGADSVMTWSRACENATSTVPDSSVYLG